MKGVAQTLLWILDLVEQFETYVLQIVSIHVRLEFNTLDLGIIFLILVPLHLVILFVLDLLRLLDLDFAHLEIPLHVLLVFTPWLRVENEQTSITQLLICLQEKSLNSSVAIVQLDNLDGREA